MGGEVNTQNQAIDHNSRFSGWKKMGHTAKYVSETAVEDL